MYFNIYISIYQNKNKLFLEIADKAIAKESLIVKGYRHLNLYTP